ncbi:MAG TPA: hypothetical protein VM755_00125 [Stellaceae bacterium]|nr:hypothetical protein [Stellaceae bacterium]
MENIDMKVDGDKLVLTFDLKAPGKVSSTGRTKLIATTRGAVPVPHAKRAVTLAVNLMAKE